MADFAVQAATPPKRVLKLAQIMFEAQQRAVLIRAGRGSWVAWQLLPQYAPDAYMGWCAAAEAALAHFASDPAFPIADHLPGGHCG
ncbi:hypothetical protein O4H52_08040 [Sphingomonadaceae bacterium G21617-S1]|nr:hypothetical protein [Sphingomonadaceae bacterium G21617-S1]